MNAGARSLGHDEIARLIPHQGSMCLLSRIERWDAQTLVGFAGNHRDASHPLRTRRGLLSCTLIEYAAQATAAHGGLQLLAANGPAHLARPGLLASARQVKFSRLALDQLPPLVPDELRIEVRRDAGDERHWLYAFTAHHGATELASGRIAVALASPPTAT